MNQAMLKHHQEAELNIELLAKYDTAGPRYTSYPTAIQFTEDFGRKDYEAIANRSHDSIAPLSLYIHVPFCHSLCYFCACNKIVTKDKQAARVYLDHLYKEMASLAEAQNLKRPVTQLHWGGGTPTFLTGPEMTELMYTTGQYFNLTHQEKRDYSIEIDPRSTDSDTIALLKGLGFNRVSLGIQDFNPQVQQAIHRVQSDELVTSLVHQVRDHEFDSLNFDLIYGLPYQTPDSMKRTLDTVIELSPDRISCYSYAHMPDRFKPQKGIDRHTVPCAEDKLEMLAIIITKLTEAGYRHIGMDHFVKPEDELAIAQDTHELQRNFQGYSVNKGKDIIGLGVSAISSFADAYTQNHRQLEHYYQAIEAGQLPVARGVSLSDEDILRREVIQRLICHRELDIAPFEQEFKIDFNSHFANELEQLQPLAADGILAICAERITILPPGFALLRNICMVFDQYLASKTTIPLYSKTI